MKHFFTSPVVLLAMALCTSLHAQYVEWMNIPYFGHYANEDSKISAVTGVANDEEDNVYISGTFSGYPQSGGSFISKYDKDGNLVWQDTLKWASCPSMCKVGEYLYVVGKFEWYSYGVPEFNNHKFILPPYPVEAGFILKYDLEGNILSLKQVNGVLINNIRSYNDKLYITGFAIQPNFDNYYIDGGGYFLAQLDLDMDFEWVRKVSDTGIKELSISDSNNIFLSIGSAYTSALEVYKYNTNGSLQWSRQLPSSAISISADNYGNCYLFGQFLGTKNFDGHIVTNPYSSSSSSSSSSSWGIYMARLNSDGEFDWAITPAGDSLNVIDIYPVDSILYVSGYHGYPSITKENYIAKYSLDGIPMEHLQATVYQKQSANDANYYSIGALHHDGVYVYGRSGGQYKTGYIGKISWHGPSEEPTVAPVSSAGLTIYPNPGSVFTLHYGVESASGYSLIVRNAIGQAVISKTYLPQAALTETLDMRSYAEGIYFVELVAGDTRATKKLVVK